MQKEAVSLNKVTKAVMNRAHQVKNWDKGIASDIVKGKRFPLRPREAFYAPKDLNKKTVKQIKTLSAGNVPYEKYLREMYKQNLSGVAQLSKAAELVKESKKKCKKKSKKSTKMSKSAILLEKLAKKDKDGGMSTLNSAFAGTIGGLASGAGVDALRRRWASSPNRANDLMNAINPFNLKKTPKMKVTAATRIMETPNRYLKVLGAAGLGAGLLFAGSKNKKKGE